MAPASCLVMVVRSWGGRPPFRPELGSQVPPVVIRPSLLVQVRYHVPLGTLLVTLDRDLLPVLGNAWKNIPRAQ